MPAFPQLPRFIRSVASSVCIAALCIASAFAADPSPSVHPKGAPLPFMHQGPFVTAADGDVLSMDSKNALRSSDDGRTWIASPLFAEPAYEPRRPRNGFLSIFGGRPRYEAQAAPAAQAPAARTAPAPSRGGAQPMDATNPAETTDQNEDLEIPSFLRRLAN